MTASNELAIVTHGLRKEYRGVTALHGLDLRVPRDAICGFLGPNGAGKSTAIKLLLGLARPTGGSGTIFGHDILRESVPIRRRVGYLAQDPRYYEHLTARQTLRFVARFFYRGPAAAVERRIAETLDLVGLADRADRPIKGFSGGERQRLGIAQAQINQPELLILDEPAAALDPLGRRDVLEVMARLRGQTTIFYSTHILDDVQRVSDSVVIMDRGRLVRQAPIAEVLAETEGVMYQITLKGDTSAAQARIGAQSWVAHLRAETVAAGGPTTLEVAVTDDAAAEAHLLELLADDRCTVLAFGRKARSLEDAFVRLMEGEPYGH
jgi:ABC-2 type transport system ATP-binding protein